MKSRTRRLDQQPSYTSECRHFIRLRMQSPVDVLHGIVNKECPWHFRLGYRIKSGSVLTREDQVQAGPGVPLVLDSIKKRGKNFISQSEMTPRMMDVFCVTFPGGSRPHSESLGEIVPEDERCTSERSASAAVGTTRRDSASHRLHRLNREDRPIYR